MADSEIRIIQSKEAGRWGFGVFFTVLIINCVFLEPSLFYDLSIQFLRV